MNSIRYLAWFNLFEITYAKIIVGAFFLLITAGELLAATYYVSVSGNDANVGSLSAPFKTIQKAANTATAGDTVYVRGGTYF